MKNMNEAAKEVADDPKKVIRESSKDWVQYIQEHPLQSILFGLSIYYAIKGFFK